MAFRSSITHVMNRIMDYALDRLTTLGFKCVGYFHTPSWSQLGNSKDHSSCIFGEFSTGDLGRALVMMVGAVIGSPLQRPGLGGILRWF